MIGTAVVAIHFLGLNSGFRRHHLALYDGVVRWIFAGVTLAGWLIGILTKVHPVTVGMWSAFIAGGIIVTAMREELPNEADTRFFPFLSAIVITTALLLLVEKLPKF